MERRGRIQVALLLFTLSFLWSECSGITCKCATTSFYPEPAIEECIRNGEECSGGDNFVCSTTILRDEFSTNPTGDITYRCLDLSLDNDNAATCDGTRNTATRTSLCCHDRDYCNDDLQPTLPPENFQPSQSTTAVAPTANPPTEDLIRCFCDSTLESQQGRCPDDTNIIHCDGHCYQRMFVIDNAVHMEWNCIQADDQQQIESLCSNGGLVSEETVVQCCDEGDLCNLQLITTEPPTEGSTTESPQSDAPGLTTMHYSIISAVVVVLAVGIVIILVFIVLMHLYKQRTEMQRKQSKQSTVMNPAHANTELAVNVVLL